MLNYKLRLLFPDGRRLLTEHALLISLEMQLCGLLMTANIVKGFSELPHACYKNHD